MADLVPEHEPLAQRVHVRVDPDLSCAEVDDALEATPDPVDEAAKAALDLGVPTYRFLRRYLERRPPAPLTLRQVDPLIRQLTLYRDLIDRRTGDPQ